MFSRTILRVTSLLIVVGLMVITLLGVPAKGEPASASVSIMPLHEVKPGMKGTIRTVFQGDQIEEFQFEVLGTMQSVLGPKTDIILVRLIGAKPEYTGVVAGMSGSPAMIDGRLVGALSLRFGAFAKEPIGGLTPIESMLPLFDIPWSARQQRAAAPAELHTTDAPATVTQTSAASPSRAAPLLEPIPTPLFFSGFSQSIVDHFAPFFGSYHLVPMLAGSGGATSLQFRPESAADFVPGAPVSAVLVRGDLGLYATGTISYRSEDRILAFGHPLFQIGSVNMPMAKARILATLPSSLGSFKIAQLGETVGTISQDRLTAICGLIGVSPSMIPITINVHSPSRGIVPMRYEVFQHPAITPVLVNVTLAQSVFNTLEQNDELTIDYTVTIQIEGHADVVVSDSVTSFDRSFFQPVAITTAGRIGSMFARLFGNPVEAAKITGLRLEFKLSEQRRAATLEELRVSKHVVSPGDEVDVYAVVRPFRAAPIIAPLKLTIPASVRRGEQLTLVVCDGSTLRALEEQELSHTTPSLRTVIEWLNRQRSNRAIYLRLSQVSPGYVVEDRLLPSLPLSVMSVIEARGADHPVRRITESVLLVNSVATDYVVTGRKELTLTVR